MSKTSTWQFAQDTLGRALGTALPRWTRDPQGIYFGGNEMLMTPPDARLRRAVPERRARGRPAGDPLGVGGHLLRAEDVSRFDEDREYGYGWWIDEVGGHTACFAWGFGGQYVLVFRDLRTVVAVTSSTTTSDQRHGYRRQLLDLIGAHVLPLAVDHQRQP